MNLQIVFNIKQLALTNVHVEMYWVWNICTTQLFGHLVHNRLVKIMAPSALSPLTARGHPETRLVSVSRVVVGWKANLQPCDIIVYFVHMHFVMSLTAVCACVFLAVEVVMSHVPSSLLPGECVWGESCLWLSWTQMCWTACTRWDVSETESSSHVTCNVKSKSLLSLAVTVILKPHFNLIATE